MPSVPIWFVAFVAAAVAPLAVGALQKAIVARARRRTLDVIARAGLTRKITRPSGGPKDET